MAERKPPEEAGRGPGVFPVDLPESDWERPPLLFQQVQVVLEL